MSILGKIRSRAGLLVAIIGIALAAFVLGDIFTSGRSIFSSRETNVGVIGGDAISINEFNGKVQTELENAKKNNPNAPVDENKTEQIVQSLWQQTVNEHVLNKEYDKLGVAVSPEELTDQMIGKEPNPIMSQYFSDQQTGKIIRQYATPDGRLNITEVRKYIAQMNEAAEKSWVMLEKYIHDARLQSKYNNLIKKGLYVTTAEAKHDSIEAAASYTVKYVEKKYASEPDSLTKISDNDLLTWYNSHQYKFKVKEPARSIEYVTFNLAPSRKDIETTKADMKELIEEFKTKKDKEDTAFVLAQSDSKNYTARFVKKGSLNPEVDSIISKGIEGTVVGPVEENGKLVLYKVLGTKFSSDSAKVRHLLISYKGVSRDTTIHRTKEKAKALADSLAKLVTTKKKKLEDLVPVYTEDPGSKNAQEGKPGYKGDYGWFTEESGFVQPFKDAGLTGEKGKVTVVETDFGYHVIEVLDKTKPTDKIHIVTIERSEVPGKNTVDSVYQKAVVFAGKNNTADLFEKAVVKDGMNKLIAQDIKPTERNIRGLDSPKELIRWMYEDDRKKGDVSQPFQMGERFVVAMLSSIKEPGIAPLEEVKDKVEAEVKKQKKADKFIEQFNKALAGAGKIEDVGAKVNEPAQTAENLNFNNPFIPGVGQENDVMGVISALQTNKLSKPIEGNSGVFVVLIDKVTKGLTAMDMKTMRKQSLNTLQSRVDAEVFEALKDNAHIKDNRAKFY